MVKTRQEKFKIGHLNTRSLIASFADFSNLLRSHCFDVLAVSESWLNINISDDILSIPGYRLFRKDREGRGGGVAAYVSSRYDCEEVDINVENVDALEQLWINIKYNKVSVLIAIVYRPPHNNIANCIEIFDNILSRIVPIYDKIIVTGDVNIDLLNLSNPLSQCFNAYGFSQVVNEPTRITQHSVTLLDPIFISDTELFCNSGTLNADTISDHRLIFCNLNIIVNRSKQRMYTFRDFKYFVYEDFMLDLNNLPWQNILNINDIDEKVHFLTQNIIELFDNHAPIRTVRINKPHAPWLTDVVKTIMKQRDRAYNKYEISRTQENWENYKELRNFATAAIKREKTAYLKFTQERDTIDLWKKLKIMNIQSKSKPSLPENLQDFTKINDFFLSVYNKDKASQPILNYYCTRKYKENAEFKFNLVNREHIECIVLNLKSNASGVDKISLQMLKLCMPVISIYLTHLINLCLEKSYFPKYWKYAVICPIPKVNNPLEYKDLRPISLLSILSKILEKVVYLQINDFFIKQKIYPKNQSGFRQQHSTTTALLNISDNIIRGLDEKLATALVLLDFSKAFDTVDHDLLCAKLRYYGFDHSAVMFFECYLRERYQSVRTNLGMSQPELVSSGVPQGSILGPLLFLVYTFDIYSQVDNCDIQSYADDTQISLKFDPIKYDIAANEINKDLEKICEYCEQHKLKLNSDKTVTMLFTSRSNYENLKANLHLKIADQQLVIASQARNLGIVFDQKLKFVEHVNNLLKNSYVRLKLLYANKSILNYKVRKKLCETIVMPLYYYCDIVYYPCLDTFTKNRIQKIQNTCCRFVHNLRKFDHISDKFRELNWLNVNNTWLYHLLVFVQRLLITSTPDYLKNKLILRNEIHDRSIRNNKVLTMPQHSSAAFQRSFTYTAIHHYNLLNINIKSKNVKQFKKELKTYLLGRQ